MIYTESIKKFFVSVTILVLGTICLLRIGTIDLHSSMATGVILIPAVIVMGYLG